LRDKAPPFSAAAGLDAAEARQRLLETALALSGELDVDHVAARLRSACSILPGVSIAGLGVNDPERELVQRVTIDLSNPAVPLERHDIPHFDSEIALFGRPPETFVSSATNPRPEELAAGEPRRLPAANCVLVPLLLPQRLVGSLFAGYRDGFPIGDAHVKYLEQLARLVTPVVWNCSTHERFQRGDRRRDTLIALSGAINASFELGPIIAAARDALEALSDPAGCSIDLLESDGRHYRSYVSRTGAPRALEPLLRALAGSPLAWAREHRRSYESDDLARTTRFEIDAALRDGGARRYVLAPMISRGEVIGAIFMGSTESRPALRVDVWLYENIALQVGLAIESARRLRQLRELSENLTQQNVYLREELQREHEASEMVGRSLPMGRLRESIQRVARIDSTVLITGQTGVGKELVAHAIHAAGRRADQSLVKVNCAAIPETMVESELFGHERGAFTSAVAQRIGRFELARGGTLLLDEIGELSLAVQAKLLRVLQDGEFERVGGAKTLRSDARIIAATNRDLLRCVESGTFRSDLYYRLNVFPIHVPALEERREDIPLMVDAFVAQFGRRMGKRFDGLDPASLEGLMDRPWPGNIRELRHVIERAMILCDGPTLQVERAAAPRTGVESPPPAPPGAIRTLRAAEAEHIRRVLAAADERIEGPRGAAALLGLKPSTLRSKMKRLGICRRPG